MTTYAASSPHQAVFIAYINGIEIPAKSASMRYGVWQVPEMQLELVADPVLIRLGAEDRVQVAVFYYDDCAVDPSVPPAFRLFGEGEITAWGYRNTASGRSIVFTVINQIQIFTQLFIQFMTTVDEMAMEATTGDTAADTAIASGQMIYPYVLFNQGLLPGKGQSPSFITRPFDYLYNAVKGMTASNVGDTNRTIPASNFFTRWARITNFHNRFVASPFFDEVTDNANIFPVLKALQNTTAAQVVNNNLMPNISNTGSIWDMLSTVYQVMLMEIAMIPGMPLVSVDLASSLVKTTDFTEHGLVYAPVSSTASAWIPALSEASRQLTPKRLQNYFCKPQMFFSIPPSCNVMFPSQIINIMYEENFATQPTRTYLNDEVTSILVGQENMASIANALKTAWPPEADMFMHAHDYNPSFNGKNFLLYPEEFFKGPVMNRREAPHWLFFLKESEMAGGAPPGTPTEPGAAPATPVDNASTADQTPTPSQTGATPPPKPQSTVPASAMLTKANNGKIGEDGITREYSSMVERLRPRVVAAIQGSRIPVELVLAWISVESNGQRTATNSVGGKGIFQMRPEEITLLRTPTFPNGTTVDAVTNDTDNVVAIHAGIDYLYEGRTEADTLAKTFSLYWTDADMWRLTKLAKQNAPDYVEAALQVATTVLTRSPMNWDEFYHVVYPTADEGQKHALDNATAVGVVFGASGVMTSASDPLPFVAGVIRKAPAAPTAAGASAGAATPSASASVVDARAAAVIGDFSSDTVYTLYTKFEHFRERYARRTGAANVIWNPYVVPGFPGVLFDERATRVDLVVYFTTVQLMMTNDGQRSTALSFMYGRQLQEMFATMREEFIRNDATARGTAPQEPIYDVSKITQSFIQAELYYRRLFYGAQPLFGKDAAFDFRRVVGMKPLVPGDPPEEIFVDGPDAGYRDTTIKSKMNVAKLITLLAQLNTTLIDLKSRAKTAQDALEKAESSEIQQSAVSQVGKAVEQIQSTVKQAEILAHQTELIVLQPQIQSTQIAIDETTRKLMVEAAAVRDTPMSGPGTRVSHNLGDAASRDLVPLPATAELFENRDAAMRYNWRPICTLDEYIVFLNSKGEGEVRAYGDPRSVGARFFERIQTFTAPAPGFKPPFGVDGLNSTQGAIGATPKTFPQVRANWDEALLAYRNNVVYVKTPRT